MAAYSTLKNYIDEYITTNGQGDITGAILNDVLKSIVNSFGADYLWAGFASPSTNPGSIDQQVFFIALEAGTYTNMGNFTVPEGITVIYWDTAWHCRVLTKNNNFYLNKIGFIGDGTNLVTQRYDNILLPNHTYKFKVITTSYAYPSELTSSQFIFWLATFNGNTEVRRIAAVNAGGTILSEYTLILGDTVPQTLQIAGRANAGVEVAILIEPAIDQQPTSGSNHLVESGGTADMIWANRAAVKNGYFDIHGYVQTNGSLHYGDTAFLTTGFVQFDRTQPITYKGDSGNQYVNVIAFYDKNKQYIAGSGISNIDTLGREQVHTIESADIPADAVYFAASSKVIQTSSFVEFKTLDVPMGVISGIQDDLRSIHTSIENVIGTNLGYNVFNPNVITDQKYIYPSNGTERNASTAYPSFISGYIDVTGFESINIVLNTGSLDGAYGYAFYDASYNIIAYGVSARLIARNDQNKNAKYFRFSQPTSKLNLLSVYIATHAIRKSLNDLSLISRQPNGLYANGITINADASTTIITETLTNYDWQLAMSCDITTLSSYVRVQKGNTDYGSSYIDIYSNKVLECYIPNGRTKEYQLGFTLGATFGVILTSTKGHVYLTIVSNAGVFHQELLYFDGTRNIVVSNGTGNSALLVNNASVNYTKGFNYKVALFGDSYAHERWGNVSGYTYNYSWTTNLKENGCKFENIGFPGALSGSVASMIQYYVKYASPNIIIWAMGMNDASDTNNQPNATWLSNLTQAIEYAESVNALLIPCTIPSVPGRNHDAKTAYIKQHFARYIDFAGCLTENGSWKTGYLASDNVHPTALGFAAMIAQALRDVPEFNY